VVIEVKDTGSGISREDQKILFDRFRQGSHKRSGSGLGLHLSKRIVETHQGTIELKSELGKGSVFTIRLPTQ
jgi:signal transduction histidine kinase